MQPGCRRWDEEVLHDVFERRDVEQIKSIQLCDSVDEDGWYSQFKNSGVYSAYKVLQKANGEGSVEVSSGFWKKLWQLKIPPKCKDLLWRAATGCLPTRFQLRPRHVDIERVCPICKQYPETIVHCLVDCSFARGSWGGSRMGLVSSGGLVFTSWLIDVFSKENKEVLEKVGMF